MNTCTRPARMLLPAPAVDPARWAVVACDQYTSQPDYWAQTDAIVGTAPSALRITLPEVYLDSADTEDRIRAIHRTMRTYLDSGVLTELPSGMMLVDRFTGGRSGRHGLLMAFDLEAYDYRPGSTSPIRPTEKTVVERIPPRLEVRRGAALELPHIMLLIDDPQRTVIEPLFRLTDILHKAYDVELMQDGGHLTGWFIPEGNLTEAIQRKLAVFFDQEHFNEKYSLTGSRPVLPFAVGDGNHSMATAKAYWEELKKTLSPLEQQEHPARWVLAELVNIHDESLEIEGIHRVLFGVDSDRVFTAAKAFFATHNAEVSIDPAPNRNAQSFPVQYGTSNACMNVFGSPWALPAATLQNFLDVYLAADADAKIDYVHGLAAVSELAQQPDTLGFLLPDPAKSDLFRGVILDGMLPRKTFSMGEAREKRYYMEAHRITEE